RLTDHLDAGSPIAVTITIAGDSAVVDFTGTGPVILATPGEQLASPPLRKGGPGGGVELPTGESLRLIERWPEGTIDLSTSPSRAVGGYNLNANRAIVSAAVLYVFRCLINEDIPLNSGVLAPVQIVLPECLLNPPEREDPAQCAAIVGGNVETS